MQFNCVKRCNRFESDALVHEKSFRIPFKAASMQHTLDMLLIIYHISLFNIKGPFRGHLRNIK